MVRIRPKRFAFTLVELLVVIAIIGTLIGILLPAIHRIRQLAARIQCSNQLRQVGLGLIRFHDERGRLPPGVTPNEPASDYPYMSWAARILPYIDQQSVWQHAVREYGQRRLPFRGGQHETLAMPIQTYFCTVDPRGPGPHLAGTERQVGLTSYLGVLGTNYTTNDGVLFRGSSVRMNEITDGQSHTLLLGERPPSPDYWYGWWYAGVGMASSGSPDMLLGVRELRLRAIAPVCESGPFAFVAGQLTNQCDVFHFWSLHPGGANFAMCDGSVHFLSYSADSILPALATRACNEAVELP